MGVKITELPDGGVPDAASLIPLVKGGVTVSSPVEDVATRVAAEIFPDAALTGSPTAPTQSAGDNSTKLATTAYADGAVATLSGSVSTALAAKAPLASPALTGDPTAPTQSQADSSTKLATTGYVRAAISAILDGVSSSLDTLSEIATALGLKAPIASPTFTGTPAAPTASTGTDTTQIATTEFVQDAIAEAPLPSYAVANSWWTYPSAHSKSDDFRDATASAAKWSQWNPGTAALQVTYQESDGRVILRTTGASANQYCGLYQARPSTEYTIRVAMTLARSIVSGLGVAGLALLGDVASAPTTEKISTARMYDGAGSGFALVTADNYTGAGEGTNIAVGYGGLWELWVQLRVKGTSVSLDYSYDGETWRGQATATISFTPTNIALVTNCTGASPNKAWAAFRDFRVFDGVSAIDDSGVLIPG